jgi:hypothetical protein
MTHQRRGVSEKKNRQDSLVNDVQRTLVLFEHLPNGRIPELTELGHRLRVVLGRIRTRRAVGRGDKVFKGFGNFDLAGLFQWHGQ